jgi:hypothetical protein
MGCLGDVDSGCCLVCLVACLVDWLCAFGVVDVLIFDSLGLLTTYVCGLGHDALDGFRYACDYCRY